MCCDAEAGDHDRSIEPCPTVMTSVRSLRENPRPIVLWVSSPAGSRPAGAVCSSLAGKSALNRLELSCDAASRHHRIVDDPPSIEALLVDVFLDAHRAAQTQIALGLDGTDDPLHGRQEGRFFAGGSGSTTSLASPPPRACDGVLQPSTRVAPAASPRRHGRGGDATRNSTTLTPVGTGSSGPSPASRPARSTSIPASASPAWPRVSAHHGSGFFRSKV